MSSRALVPLVLLSSFAICACGGDGGAEHRQGELTQDAGCPSAEDAGPKATPVLADHEAIGVEGIRAACVDYCSNDCAQSDNCSVDACNLPCEERCASSFDPVVVRAAFLPASLQCQSEAACDPTQTETERASECLAKIGEDLPLTDAGRAFCASHAAKFDPCMIEIGSPFGCTTWTKQVVDDALDFFAPCMTYPNCSELVACVQSVFAHKRPPEYGESCETAHDGLCNCPPETDVDDCKLDTGNSCASARNGTCDGPDKCREGTDTYDCQVADHRNSCVLAYNHECNEPGSCTPGSDTYDCGNVSVDERCEWAHNGQCDDPGRCPPGTDAADCPVPPAPDAGVGH